MNLHRALIYILVCLRGRRLVHCLILIIKHRTAKRPVPLEHCIFYSGELYKICEHERMMPQGLKAAKDVYRKKNSPAVTGGGGHQIGSSAANERARIHRRDNSSREKQNKHFGSQNSVNFSGAHSGGNNYWGSRRSEASVWLSLIKKLSKISLLPVCASVRLG